VTAISDIVGMYISVHPLQLRMRWAQRRVTPAIKVLPLFTSLQHTCSTDTDTGSAPVLEISSRSEHALDDDQQQQPHKLATFDTCLHVIAEPSMRPLFEEYTKRSLCIESVSFIIAAEDYSANLHTSPPVRSIALLRYRAIAISL